MTHKVGLAIACLHISAVLCLLVGSLGFVAMLLAERDRTMALVIGISMFVFCLGLVVGIEFVAWGLRRRKFWAWVAGLCIFAVYLPSLFLPLGALGMWGLLDNGSRAEFGAG